jgi:hypothetical protein
MMEIAIKIASMNPLVFTRHRGKGFIWIILFNSHNMPIKWAQ